jgi:FMN reductase
MLIVGIGGTQRPGSASEAALREALDAVAAHGFETQVFSAERLQLPLYNPEDRVRTLAAAELVAAFRAADGIIISSPGYHGTVSGLVKNAIDYVEDLVADPERPYFDGLPIGCIGVAYGWQSAVSTLNALRDIAHALRGWPTPYGAAVNASEGAIRAGTYADPRLRTCLRRVGDQVAAFASAARQPIPAA